METPPPRSVHSLFQTCGAERATVGKVESVGDKTTRFVRPAPADVSYPARKERRSEPLRLSDRLPAGRVFEVADQLISATSLNDRPKFTLDCRDGQTDRWVTEDCKEEEDLSELALGLSKGYCYSSVLN